jgi:hypothetical protein
LAEGHIHPAWSVTMAFSQNIKFWLFTWGGTSFAAVFIEGYDEGGLWPTGYIKAGLYR